MEAIILDPVHKRSLLGDVSDPMRIHPQATTVKANAAIIAGKNISKIQIEITRDLS